MPIFGSHCRYNHKLKFEFFIANRILKAKTASRKISRPVVRISIWAIALGMIIMILAIATGTGLRKEIRDKVIGFGGHIQILNYQPNARMNQNPVFLKDSLLKSIENYPFVKHLHPTAQKAGILKNEDLFEGILLKGVDQNYNWGNFNNYLVSGRVPNFQLERSDSILVSKKLAEKLNINLGAKVSVYFVREAPKAPLLRYFYVSGLFETNFEDIDNSLIIGDLRHVQRLNQWDSTEVGGYEVFLTSEDDIDESLIKLRDSLPYHLDALSTRQLNEQLFQWLDLFDINIIMILSIMLIVAVINISIALLILILERTQMVGILKALGSNNVSIRKIFLINASYLIFRGLLIGNSIGIGLCLIQQKFGLIKLDPSTYYVSKVAVNIDLGMILLLNFTTLMICLFCLILPSLLITKISPVKAIRFD